MAITTENSTQYGNTVADPRVMNPTQEAHGRLRVARFNFTQGASAGDAGSIARLVRLPKGKVRVILPLSRVAFSALGASRTLDMGWEAYRTDEGSGEVAADPNGMDDGVDVSSAGAVVPGGTVGGDETVLFESLDGVVLTAQINDGTIPAAATLDGYLVYVMD
ncbi:MAG: hypothetical protein JJ899_14465 [Alphaproteobacteria bacterium]|nr:hypothetical protein [Alphaproteobacteria bacterium]